MNECIETFQLFLFFTPKKFLLKKLNLFVLLLTGKQETLVVAAMVAATGQIVTLRVTIVTDTSLIRTMRVTMVTTRKLARRGRMKLTERNPNETGKYLKIYSLPMLMMLINPVIISSKTTGRIALRFYWGT